MKSSGTAAQRTGSQGLAGRPVRLERLRGGPSSSKPVHETLLGQPRRLGVEIEFAGLEMKEAAAVLAEASGGRVERHTDYEQVIETPTLGSLKLEVDLHRLQQLGRKKVERGELGILDRSVEGVLSKLAGQVVPLELVTEPLQLDQLDALDRLVHALARQGAKGTNDQPWLALGVHYNPEVPSLEPRDLHSHLRAYVLLEDWLRNKLQVDLARRVTPFVDAFPEAYVQYLLTRSSAPTLEELVGGYLAHNPTRNRSLDMLPLFTYLDAEHVQRFVDDPRVRARPTFHYRLTNSLVGEDGWSILRGWRLWLVVEDLAADLPRLSAMTRDYTQRWTRSPLASGAAQNWAESCERWLA